MRSITEVGFQSKTACIFNFPLQKQILNSCCIKMPRFVALLATVVLVTVTSASVLPSSHKNVEGFTYLGRFEGEKGARAKDYYIGNLPTNHATAQSNCRSNFGGILTFVLTATQDQNLRYFVDRFNTYYHIGGTRSSSGWFWTSPLQPIPVGYTNWLPGQPNPSGGSCLCVTGDTVSYGWFSCQCSAAYKYICEV